MYDIIVVGGGPAGLTAALYAARAGKSVLVLEGAATGGQIIYSPLVENYPGLPKVSGFQFAQQLTGQVEELGVKILSREVTAFRTKGHALILTAGGEELQCTALVLATGVSHRKLGLPEEDALIGAGVSYCAVCDGAFFAGRTVAVVGGGDTALQDALFLANRCKKVLLIHRRDMFRGEQRHVDRLRERDNVEFLLSHTVEGLSQEGGQLSGVTVLDKKSGQTRLIPLDGVFAAVGQVPHNEAFAQLVTVDEGGYLMAGESCATSLPGVFAAGDCRVKEVRQLTTAVGDGAVAGLAACGYVDDIQGL